MQLQVAKNRVLMLGCLREKMLYNSYCQCGNRLQAENMTCHDNNVHWEQRKNNYERYSLSFFFLAFVPSFFIGKYKIRIEEDLITPYFSGHL